MNLIGLLLRSSWLTVSLAIVTGLISGISSTALIALINLTLAQSPGAIATIIWSFIGLCLLMLVTNIFSQVLLSQLSQGAIYEMRMRLSQRILASPLRQLEEMGAPRLIAVLTDDIQSVSIAFFSIPIFCTNIAVFATCLIYLTTVSWSVSLLMLVILVLGVGSFQVLINRGRVALDLAREEQDQLFQHLRSLTEGIKELKLHFQRQQAFLTEELKNSAIASRNYNIASAIAFSIAGSWGLALIFISLGLLIFVIPKFIVVESATLSSYALVSLYLVLPLQIILNTIPILNRADIAWRKIETLGLSLAANTTEKSLSNLVAAQSWQKLELVGVTHAYHSEKEENGFTLGPINLTFYPGELIFLVGGNGSGKSTLAKLLVGLYAPESGQICLDGKPITDDNREWYRQHFSTVFADFYLFERLLGIEIPRLDAQTEKYLVKLHLEHKVQVKNGTLSTTALSQGQRKRLALLTAYLEDRPIYLFDEWASDQDPQFKEIFYKQILLELKQQGKTIIAISHDDRYFHLADRVLKLDYGKLEYDQHSGD